MDLLSVITGKYFVIHCMFLGVADGLTFCYYMEDFVVNGVYFLDLTMDLLSVITRNISSNSVIFLELPIDLLSDIRRKYFVKECIFVRVADGLTP
jgi:hypothetical protein